MSYKPVVQTDATGKWYGNALRFATHKEAEDNARDLMARWALVLDYSVEESTDPVNYRWVDGKLVPVENGESND